jgi:hypothetical protein
MDDRSGNRAQAQRGRLPRRKNHLKNRARAVREMDEASNNNSLTELETNSEKDESK